MAEAPLIPHHELSVRCRIGSLHLDAQLPLTQPWTLLFGPSGSGKTSLLRAACGLLDCNNIRFVRLEANNTLSPLQDATTHTPPHLRNLSWAPQNASLFPHLNVRDNIAFAAHSLGASNPQHQTLIADAMRLFRIDTLENRLPRDLSGGERQRVNLARAFATPGCKLMLLDEPFTGIDHSLRDELLPAMRTWLRDRNIPALSVTHNVEEALQLHADVVRIRDGKIEARGLASQVLAAEREHLLASLSTSR